jgi:uncharacterized membrane protein YjjP (DUF1212 family)
VRSLKDRAGGRKCDEGQATSDERPVDTNLPDSSADPSTFAKTLGQPTLTPINAAVQLAMRVGGKFLSTGMSASDVVAVMRRITQAYGVNHVLVDVTYTAITVSYYPEAGSPPITSHRSVQPDVIDYHQVRELDKLSDKIQAGLPVGKALEAFQRIQSAAHPYPAWVSMVGIAGAAAAVSLLFTTSWKIILIAFLTGCVVDRALSVMGSRRVPPFFQNLATAALVTMIAAGITAAGTHGIRFFAGLDPNLVVVGGIVILVSGLKFAGAVQDAIDQFYVTASARVFEVAMRTAGIVIGIVVGLQIAVRLGVHLSLSPNPVALGPTGAQFAGATLIAAFFALWAYADMTTIGLSAAMGLLGWAGHAGMIQAGAGEAAASATGALVAALAATLIVRRTNVPGFALVTAAVLPLVPGLSLYNGLIQVIGTTAGNADPAKGAKTLFLAVAVAVGIAAGASLGTYLGRPIADQLHRIRTRAHDHIAAKGQSG